MTGYPVPVSSLGFQSPDCFLWNCSYNIVYFKDERAIQGQLPKVFLPMIVADGAGRRVEGIRRALVLCRIVYFLYACESWTLTADLQRRIQAMEMRCYRRLLNISYTEHITNVEVRNRIERAIGPYEDLLTTVKRRKLKWYGHVSRSSGLSKTIMQGTVKGGRRRGGQRKRWEDNIKDWTCLRAAESLRVSKDRNGWRDG